MLTLFIVYINDSENDRISVLIFQNSYNLPFQYQLNMVSHSYMSLFIQLLMLVWYVGEPAVQTRIKFQGYFTSNSSFHLILASAKQMQGTQIENVIYSPDLANYIIFKILIITKSQSGIYKLVSTHSDGWRFKLIQIDLNELTMIQIGFPMNKIIREFSNLKIIIIKPVIENIFYFEDFEK